VTNNQ